MNAGDTKVQKDEKWPGVWATYGLVALLWFVHAGANLIWIRVDTRLPYWDMAGHALSSVYAAVLPYISFPGRAFSSLLRIGPYPPLVYFVTSVFAQVLPLSYDTMLVSQILFLGVLVVSTYGIGTATGGRRVGLLAGMVISLYPIVYGLSRHYLLDVPLTAMVALAVWLLLETRGFQRFVPSLLLGLALGLGMLTKWTFAVFVVVPILVVVVEVVRKHERHRIRNGLVAMVAGALVGAPWYLYNLSRLTDFLALGQQYATMEGDTLLPVWQLATYYARAFVEMQVLLPWAILFLIGAVLMIRRQAMRPSALLLLAWIFVPYMIFSLMANKDVRYTMPYLPAVATVTAAGFASVLTSSRFARWGGVVMLACGLLQFVGLTFGLSNRLPTFWPRQLTLGSAGAPWRLYSETVHIASPMEKAEWHIEDILYDLIVDWTGQARTRPKAALLVLPDAPHFEAQGFAYFAALDQLPVEVSFVTGVVPIDGTARLDQSDYVVTKTGSQGPAFSLQTAGLLTAQVETESENGQRYVLLFEYSLPDGSLGRLYRVAGVASGE